jgi:hypothetical protein
MKVLIQVDFATTSAISREGFRKCLEENLLEHLFDEHEYDENTYPEPLRVQVSVDPSEEVRFTGGK